MLQKENDRRATWLLSTYRHIRWSTQLQCTALRKRFRHPNILCIDEPGREIQLFPQQSRLQGNLSAFLVDVYLFKAEEDHVDYIDVTVLLNYAWNSLLNILVYITSEVHGAAELLYERSNGYGDDAIIKRSNSFFCTRSGRTTVTSRKNQLWKCWHKFIRNQLELRHQI